MNGRRSGPWLLVEAGELFQRQLDFLGKWLLWPLIILMGLSYGAVTVGVTKLAIEQRSVFLTLVCLAVWWPTANVLWVLGRAYIRRLRR